MSTDHTWSDSPIHEQIRKMNDTPTPDTDEHEFPCMTWALQDHPMVVRADFARKLERELTAVTEQRDRLVEALEIAANRFRYPEFECNWENVSKEIESALQSLTPKS